MTQQSQNDTDPEFRSRTNVIFDEWHAGNLPFQSALEKLELMKQEALDDGHLANQGAIENIIGIMQGYRANFDASILHFEKAREFYEKAGNRERMTSCILNLGESYRLKGNFTRARRYFHAAYDAGVEMKRISIQSIARANEGQILVSMGHFDKARTILDEALSLTDMEWEGDRRDQDRRDNYCEIHHSLALICLEEGKLEEAWDHAKITLKYGSEMKQVIRMGYAYRALAEVITGLGKSPEDGYSDDPDEYYKQAADAFREVKAEGELARTLFLQAKSLAKRGKSRKAARLFQQVMVIFTKLGMADDAAKAAEAQLQVL